MAGGIYEQSEWSDSRWDCVTVCDGCHTVVWGTFWDHAPMSVGLRKP